jgi:EamA domain-containing membrane protein RarD
MPMPYTGLLYLPYASPLFWSLPMTFLLVSELIGDFLGKQWTLHKKSIFFFTSLSFYVIGNAFWLFAVLKGVGLTRGSVIFAIGQEIIAVAMGIVYFKESLSKKQFLGVILGLITIALMGGF